MRQRLPANRFYWALLDGSKLTGSRRKREEALSYLFEAQIPQPLETVHVIYRDEGKDRFVACGIAKEALRGEADPSAVTLTPDSIPPFLGVALDPEPLNVLVGEFTPAHVRLARRRVVWEAAAVLIAASIFLAIGFERRRAAFEAIRADAEGSTSQLYASRLGYKPGGALPPALQLQSELRTLRATRVEAPSATNGRDAALSLSNLLSLWPRDAHAEVDSVQVTASAIHVQGDVAETNDAQSLEDAIAKIPGWRAEIPSVHGTDSGVRFTFQWNAEALGGSR
jgi:hypothetical protein